MKKTTLIVSVFAFIIGLTSGVANAKLVACVGDSVTYGYGLANRASNSYPAQLATILQSSDSEWETQNFGVSGATLLRNTNKPYVAQSAYNRALESEPDVVVIQLGGNDTARATILQIEQNYISDYLALIDAFAQLVSQPKIFVCYPPPAFGGSYGSNETLRDVIIPLIEQLPTYRDVEIIDMHTPMEDLGHLFPDFLHPNVEGAGILAEIVASAILDSISTPDFNGDEIVDIEDLIMLIDHWGQNERSVDIAPTPFGDGIVDALDLVVLMSYWQQEIFPAVLMAYWKLDEEEGDIAYNSISDNDGILISDPVWLPDGGQIGGALTFDGIDDYAETGFILDPSLAAFSVFAWIKGGAPGQVIISQLDGIGTSETWLGMDALGGNLMTGLVPPPVGRFVPQPIISESIVSDGQWYHVGFVWDGSYRSLYVDGVEVAKDNAAQNPLKRATGGLYISAGKTLAAGTFFSGLIDDVRIYDKALTPEEIEALTQ